LGIYRGGRENIPSSTEENRENRETVSQPLLPHQGNHQNKLKEDRTMKKYIAYFEDGEKIIGTSSCFRTAERFVEYILNTRQTEQHGKLLGVISETIK
jgi:citrate lyase synthetase